MLREARKFINERRRPAEKFIKRNAGRIAATVVFVASGVGASNVVNAANLNQQIASGPSVEQQQKLIDERNGALDWIEASLTINIVTGLIYGTEKFSRRSRLR